MLAKTSLLLLHTLLTTNVCVCRMSDPPLTEHGLKLARQALGKRWIHVKGDNPTHGWASMILRDAEPSACTISAAKARVKAYIAEQYRYVKPAAEAIGSSMAAAGGAAAATAASAVAGGVPARRASMPAAAQGPQAPIADAGAGAVAAAAGGRAVASGAGGPAAAAEPAASGVAAPPVPAAVRAATVAATPGTSAAAAVAAAAGEAPAADAGAVQGSKRLVPNQGAADSSPAKRQELNSNRARLTSPLGAARRPGTPQADADTARARAGLAAIRRALAMGSPA
jgi:hypothetical protein